MTFLSPSQEKNLYGLGSDEDEDDLTEMNPEEMQLAYVAPWEKTAIAASSAGACGAGMRVPVAVVAKAKDEGPRTKRRTGARRASQSMNHHPTLQLAN